MFTGNDRIRFFVGVLLCASIISIANGVARDDWTQFRGSMNTGIAKTSAKPPIEWDVDQDSVWQTEIPGVGWSSPVFDDNGLAWLTTAIIVDASPEEIAERLAGDPMAKIKTTAHSVELKAICVDLKSGSIVHNLSLSKDSRPGIINPMNSHASPTPCIGDGRVVCHFGSYGTWCLDAKTADPVWQRQFVIDHSVGPGSSPVVHGGNVILVCDGTDKQFIAAVNLSTGKDVWKTDRPPLRADDGEYRKAYSTPLMVEVDDMAQAVIPGAQWIAAYDPATGAEIWRADHGDGFSVTPMAVYESGLVVFSTGYGSSEIVAVDPTGTGDVTKTHIKWRARNAPTMPSFVADKGAIFAITDTGILSRIDAKSGVSGQRKRIGGNFSASPMLAGGNLYLSSREGVVSVVGCDETMKVKSTNKFDGQIMASPALLNNDLIVRTAKKLYRISKTN